MKLSEIIDSGSLSRLNRDNITPGDIFEISLTPENGITPKPGDTSRNKYFVVLGFNSEGEIYGGVIINSHINRNLPPHIRIYHMPISSTKYPFLKHDSFVDCLQLKIVPLGKFQESRYLGSLTAEDLELVIGTIKESPRESRANLAQYGL
jgi:hypothetical protein